jgi:hypothetical protein
VVSSSELKLNSEAITAQDWNYIRGLFLADGYSDIRRNRNGGVEEYRVRFFLQGDEREIARKVTVLLRKAGLNPHVDGDRHDNLINLRIYSKQLLNFLPDKEALKNDPVARERFFEENRLFEVQSGLSFVAGFIDGDGSCRLTVTERRFKTALMDWGFSQTTLKFIVDYIMRFMNMLSPNSTYVAERQRKDGRNEIAGKFRKRAVNALLTAGIDQYSFKVARCLKRMTAFQSELHKYCTTGEASRILGVKPWVVRRMADAGEIKCNRTGSSAGSPDLSRRYFPIEKVKKLLKKLESRRSRNEVVKQGGVKLTVLAGMLGVSDRALEWLRLHGKLRATLVEEDHGRGSSYLVIPHDEVEKLTKRYIERKKGEKQIDEGEKNN